MSKEKIEMSDYEKGVSDCIEGKDVSLSATDEYIDGYADQYALEQMEDENLILKH
jgi:hypothetical protein